MRLRRAFLYTPADDLHKIEKACTLKADCICVDLEDAVSPLKKEEARLNAAHALAPLISENQSAWYASTPLPPLFLCPICAPLWMPSLMTS
jgi:hypothetical protein